jgi:hypothetical protein
MTSRFLVAAARSGHSRFAAIGLVQFADRPLAEHIGQPDDRHRVGALPAVVDPRVGKVETAELRIERGGLCEGDKVARSRQFTRG